MRQYTSKNYSVECFVDKATYQQFGIKSWQFLSPDILFAYDTISKFYGKKLVCNNWREGGNFQYRGLRPQGCGVGAPYGAHYRGGALDFNVPDVAPPQVQLDLVKNAELWPQITRMEDITATPTWTHIDNGNMLTEVNGIYVFKP
jgi:hypothetical protein